MSEILEFRDAMSRLGAAVSIVTTQTEAGPYGMVVSAACAVSDTPPTILVCINRNASGNALFKTSGTLCLNILGAEQHEHSALFTDPAASSAHRFGGTDEWGVLATGAPSLRSALASVDCRIAETAEMGSHTVFFAEVVAIRLGEHRSGLMYFDRQYCKLAKHLS